MFGVGSVVLGEVVEKGWSEGARGGELGYCNLGSWGWGKVFGLLSRLLLI